MLPAVAPGFFARRFEQAKRVPHGAMVANLSMSEAYKLGRRTRAVIQS
jgi:hypothetical protein